MTSVYVTVMDAFHASLSRVTAFTSVLKPSGVSAAERIRWKSTFNEIITQDILRPYALIVADPFGAVRNTEGDADIPLYDYTFIIYLERDADDFAEDAGGGIFAQGSDQAMFRAFMDWNGTIADELMAALDTTEEFFRFSRMGFAIAPERTEVRDRETEDDFFYVAYQFNVGTNE